MRKRDYDDRLGWWSNDQTNDPLIRAGHALCDDRDCLVIEAAYERLDDDAPASDAGERDFSQLRRSVAEMIEYSTLLDEHTRLRLSRQVREIDLFWADEGEPIEALRHRFRRAVIQSDQQARKLFELIKNDEDDMLVSVYLGFCFSFSDQARLRLEERIERSDHTGFLSALATAVLEKEPELFEIDRDIQSMIDLAASAGMA